MWKPRLPWTSRLVDMYAQRDTSQDLKIFRYLDPEAGHKLDPPKKVDYRRGLEICLARKTIKPDSNHERVEYHEDTTFSDLIVSEDHEYTFHVTGEPAAKHMRITWYREDGEPHPSTKRAYSLYEVNGA